MDTPGISFIKVAQVARISEPVEALVGPEPGETGEETVELPASTVGTAERRSSPTGARSWPHIILFQPREGRSARRRARWLLGFDSTFGLSRRP